MTCTRLGMMRSLLFLALVHAASAHGWVTSPLSKNEMTASHYQEGMPSDFRHEPQSCANGNLAGSTQIGGGFSCGANDPVYTQGLGTWQAWYTSAGVAVPSISPGEEIAMDITLTADHGGQSWFMIACAGHIGEDVQWTYLERAQSDRDHHFMPSNPGIYAWAPQEAKQSMSGNIRPRWVVPTDFSCPSGEVVGRWLWKTGNSCNDVENVGRKTQTFKKDEFATVVHTFAPGAWVQEACTAPPEIFINCFDFTMSPTPRPVTSTTTTATTTPPASTSTSLTAVVTTTRLRTRTTTTTTLIDTTTIKSTCADAPLPVAWSGGGVHTCLTYEQRGLAYCRHAELEVACCFCGGGVPEPMPSSTPTPMPETTTTMNFQCMDSPLPVAWSAGGVHTCSTYEQHGGLAYCAHKELAEACCFCKLV